MRGFLDVKGLTVFLIGVTILVIAVGGLIRINDAGESCPDWPKCFGTWGFDISEQEQGQWYEENPEEVDSRGAGHRYSKFQIFTEWLHRFLAGAILGPLVIANWWLIRSDDTVGSEAVMASNFSVALIIWQGAIGWLTVRMDNEHWSVALHLGSALAFLLCLFWLWLAICDHRDQRHRWIDFNSDFSSKWKDRLFWLAFVGLVTLFSGVFVSTTPGANFGCGVNGIPNSWPLCQGKVASGIEDVFAQSQMIHRWLVGMMEVILIVSCYIIWKEADEDISNQLMRNWIWAATGIYVLNVAIGAVYILSWDIDDGYMEWLSLVHLLLASSTFILLATTWIGATRSTGSVEK